MITINIRYSADSNTMRIDDISNTRIAGTTGDDNATLLNFHFDDADGTLDGFGVRVEFDVIVDDDPPYRPYMILDESMSIRIPNAIMSRVRYGSLPIQLAFSRIDSENSDEVVFYSLNKVVLSVADAIMSSATEPIDIERHPDLMDAIYSVRYDNATSSFYFTQFDGSQIKVHLSDLSEEHFEVDTYANLITLDEAESGDTATVTDTGVWYKLYGDYSVIGNWKKMPGGSILNGSDTSFPVFYAPEQSGTAGQYLESLGINQSPVWTSKASSVNDDTTLPTGSAVTSYVKSKAPKLYTKSRNDPFYSSSNELLNITNANHQDYAYVKGTDNGNAYVDLYVADRDGNVITWNKKARFYNVSLSQVQWNAVDSGITSTKVGEYDSHISNMQNPHTVTKAQVGLGNVDNTSDANKPISTATQNALNLKADKTEISTLYRPKGSVATINDLPTNAQIGDVYDVLSSGMNYVWTGSKWDELGAIIDLSPYYTKTEVDSALSGKVSKSGDTMSGQLNVWDNAVVIKNSQLTDGAIVSATPDPHGIVFSNNYASGKKELGMLYYIQDTSGNGRTVIHARKYLNNNTQALEVVSLVDGGGYGLAPSWSVGTNDNSNKILTIKMVNSLPSLVHTTGNETIAGEKTFTAPWIWIKSSNSHNLTFKDTSITGTHTGTRTTKINLLDNNDALRGDIKFYTSAGQRSGIEIGAINRNGIRHYLAVNVDENGTYNTYAPSTPSDATGNEIATAGWVNNKATTLQTNIDEKVSKSGDTMTGNLTILKSTPWVTLKNSTISVTDELASNVNLGGIHIHDMNGIGTVLNSRMYADGGRKAYIGQFGKDGTTEASIGVLVETDGTSYGLAPTPTNKTDNSTKIATTSWVTTASSVVHTTGAETISGAKTFSTTILSNKAVGQVLTSRFTGYASGDTLENTLEHTIRFEDKNAKNLGHLIYVLYNDGRRHLGFTALNHNGAYAGLGITVNADGTFSSEAPPTPSDATGKEIATASWVNTKATTLQTNIDTKVNRGGDTMTGNLTIHRNCPSLYQRSNNTDVVLSDMPSSYINIAEQKVLDSENEAIFGSRVDSDATYIRYFIAVKNYVNGVATDRRFDFLNYNDGTSAFILPQSPVTNENSKKVATTEWVNSADSVVHKTGNETIAGTKMFSTPIIDPQNQSGFCESPNSGASDSPYHLVATFPSTAWYSYDRNILVFDAVLGRSSSVIATATFEAIIQTGNGGVFGDVSLTQLSKNGIQHEVLSVENWFMVYNTTAKEVQIWTKITYGQLYIHLRSRINARRNGKNSAWTLVWNDSTTGSVNLPTEADGWTTVSCTDMSGKLMDSTPSDATGTEIATANWCNNKFVNATGDTMTGRLYLPSISAMSSNQPTPHIDFHYNNADTFTTRMIQLDGEFRITGNNIVTLGVPLTDSADNSAKIATTSWISTADCIVHKTGNETVSGGKSLTSILHIKSTNIADANTPSNDLVGTRIQFVPNNATNGGYTEYISQFVPFHYKTHTSMQIYVRRVIDGTSVNASLGIRINADGTQYATSPTTPSNANSNEIATANWVNNKLAGKVTVSTSAPSGGSDGDIWLQYE